MGTGVAVVEGVVVDRGDGSSRGREQFVPPAKPIDASAGDGAEDTEDTIDLDAWAAEGEDLTARLTRIAKQMEDDALKLPRGHIGRGALLKDAAAILGRLLDKQVADAKKDVGVAGASPVGRGGAGVAVAAIGREDAAAAYLRLLEGPAAGAGE
jgi:hypothetical protein